MAILDFPVAKKTVSATDVMKSDFPDGMRIVEIDRQGREIVADAITLVGAFMPKDSLGFGGTQHIVKEYYAGSSEPSVQVLGPREKDVTIRGSFNLRKIKDTSLYSRGKESAAQEMQELVDAMRIRGNLVKITLGEWRRYGFIIDSDFKLKTLSDIDYEVIFSIVGFNQPKNYYLVDGTDGDLIAPNKDVIAKLNAALLANQNKTTDLPVSVSDVMNGITADIAAAVGLVTGFVDEVLGDAERINASANRALGLIRNARSFISKSNRRLGAIARDVSTLGSRFVDETERTLATLRGIQSLNTVHSRNREIGMSLRNLESKYTAFISTLPLRRHFVVDGDTLQKLSIKYYGTADSWEKIMDHNKLRSAELVKGSVIEIPRI